MLPASYSEYAAFLRGNYDTTIWFACGVAAMLVGILLGGELWLFIDYPSMTITIGGGFAFCLAVHSPATLKEACASQTEMIISLEAFTPRCGSRNPVQYHHCIRCGW